jgi:hypothetical protein
MAPKDIKTNHFCQERSFVMFGNVWRCYNPCPISLQEKELMRPGLRRAILGSACMKLGLYGRPPEAGQRRAGDSRFQTLKWLPGQMSESAFLWDIMGITAIRTATGHKVIALGSCI